MSAGDNRKRGAADPSSGSSKKSKALSVTTKSIEDILERFNCPICFELPKAELYQCSNGHSVCSSCIVNLKNCPTCAVPYQAGKRQGSGKIRNHFAEEIISVARFNCTWKEQGCERQGLTGQQLTEHEEQCSFNPNPVKLCALLFWDNCDYAVSREFLRNPSLEIPVGWKDHLLATHYSVSKHPVEAALHSGSPSNLYDSCQTIEKMFNDQVRYFRGPIFRLVDNSSGNPVGLFMIWICNHSRPADAKQVSWFVVRVTDPPTSSSVQVKFTLKSSTTSEDDGVLDYETSWTGQIIGVREFGKFKSGGASERDRIKFSMPVSLLQKRYLTADGGLDLQYVFTVTPHANNKMGGSSSNDRK